MTNRSKFKDCLGNNRYHFPHIERLTLKSANDPRHFIRGSHPGSHIQRLSTRIDRWTILFYRYYNWPGRRY